MPPGWIYRYEAKGIQAYILATDKLKEIKGGSALVEGLDGLFQQACGALGCGDPERVVSPASAGGATLRFEDAEQDMAREFMSGWPLLVARHAPGLQVVQALVQEGADQWDQLHAELRRDRSRPSPELPEAGPCVLRAPRTGLPACEVTRDGALDAASRRKLEVAGDPLGDRVGPANARWVQDLEHIGHSYVGVLHADGNDLGKRIKSIKDDGGGPAEVRRFSEALTEVTLAAVRAAVDQVLVTGVELGDRLPGRPIVVGGDDVTFVLRGDLALPFAHKLLRTFEEEGRKRRADLGGPVTAAAGVALVHRSHPFHLAYRLAEGLCDFAKDECRGADGGLTPSALAFHRLTSSMSGSWRDLRELELRGDPGSQKRERWLSMCPYTLNPLEGYPAVGGLEALVDALSGRNGAAPPTGPLRELVRLQQVSAERATELLARIGEVQRGLGGEQRRAWQSVEGAMEGLSVDLADGFAPLREMLGVARCGSPLLDAMTWIRARKRSGPQHAPDANAEVGR